MKKSPQNRPPSSKRPRSIAANLAVTSAYILKAVAADKVISGGLR